MQKILSKFDAGIVSTLSTEVCKEEIDQVREFLESQRQKPQEDISDLTPKKIVEKLRKLLYKDVFHIDVVKEVTVAKKTTSEAILTKSVEEGIIEYYADDIFKDCITVERFVARGGGISAARSLSPRINHQVEGKNKGQGARDFKNQEADLLSWAEARETCSDLQGLELAEFQSSTHDDLVGLFKELKLKFRVKAKLWRFWLLHPLNEKK